MPKRIIQDIIINSVRSKSPRATAESLTRASNGVKKEVREVVKKEPPRPRTRKRILPKIIFWLCFIVAVIVLGKTSLSNFSSATIRITPNQGFINIDSQLKADRGTGAGNLAFEIMQIEQEESQVLTATGISKEGRKAKGQIIIYNTTPSDQKLVSQTRFEAPDGKIFRIQESVNVPGNGSLEATVYADKPGPEYNSGLVDFTIPGFKGTPKYEKIYGRSKTEMAGGATGTIPVVSEDDIDDINNARNALKQKIENYLTENISKQIPNDYLFYPGALKIDFSDSADNPRVDASVASPAGQFTFKEKGKATGFLFKKDDLAKVLALNYIQGQEDNINLINPDKLEFILLSRNVDDTEITFNLKGRGHFAWNIDTDSLIKALLDVKDKNYTAVFGNYPNIEKAEIIFKPSWWRSLPKKQNRIHLEIIYKNE